MSKASPKPSTSKDEHKETNGVISFRNSEGIQPHQLMEELISKIHERNLEGCSMPPSVLAILRELYELEEPGRSVEVEKTQDADCIVSETRGAASEDATQEHAGDIVNLPPNSLENDTSVKSQSKRKWKEVTSSDRNDQRENLGAQKKLSDTMAQSMALDPLAIQVKVQRLALAYVLRGKPVPSIIRRRLEDWYSVPSHKLGEQNGKLKFQPQASTQKRIWEWAKDFDAAVVLDKRDTIVKEKILSRLSDLQKTMIHQQPENRLSDLIELKKLKLLELQKKIRFEIHAEKRLEDGARMDVLLDWRGARRKPAISVLNVSDLEKQRKSAADAYTISSVSRNRAAALSGPQATILAQQMRKKEEATRRQEEEQLKRLLQQKRIHVIMERRKFLVEIHNWQRELRNNSGNDHKKRKARNDHVQAWHNRERQRLSRSERQRLQALKSDDQEAYLKLVEESKNSRLHDLLEKTDDILAQLGKKLQKQKEASRLAGDVDLNRTANGAEYLVDEENDEELAEDMEGNKRRDYMSGQRSYIKAVHAVEETVTTQPSALQGGQLRPYQMAGLQWMVSLFNNNLNGILADEMGLGKTIQTIAFIAFLMETKGIFGPHLIVCPKAVLSNWKNEFIRWLPESEIIMYDGAGVDRKALREERMKDGTFHILLTHYDLVMRDKSFLCKTMWHYLIIDEGHRLKNHESKLTTILEKYNFRHRILLTGTPIQNNLTELWALLNFILPTLFNSQESFSEWFGSIGGGLQGTDLTLTEEEELLVINRLHQVIRPFLLRRKKSEVAKELPDKRQVVLKCDMSAWQKDYYSQILDSNNIQTDGGKRNLQNTAMQLRKCCNHPFLFLQDEVRDEFDMMTLIRASGKFELLNRLLPKLKAAGHRCLLFSQMTRALDVLQLLFDSLNIKYLRLDGNVKTEAREQLLELFNTPNSEYFMFMLSTRAGGLGLNLQTADTVILFDSDWNPSMDMQAEDRAHRIGQKRSVSVFVLVSVGTVEEEIIRRAQEKRKVDMKVIQAGMFNNKSTASERKEFLESVMRQGTELIGRDVPDNEELNRLAANDEEEFLLFERIDEEIDKQFESFPAKLMTADELPSWVKSDPTPERVEDEQQLGKRQRKEIFYFADNLSDKVWEKMFEEGGDLEEHLEREYQKRVARERKLQKIENGGPVKEKAKTNR